MGTVYITNELKDRVRSKINVMRKAERSSDIPNFQMAINLDVSQLYNLGCWGKDNVHLCEQIPKSWLQKVDEGQIVIFSEVEDSDFTRTSVRFTGLKNAYARPKDGYYAKTDAELSIEYVQSLPEDTLGRAQILHHCEQAVILRGIDLRWNKVVDDIVGFLSKCKSLNEAIKLFPNIVMYIGADDMERVQRKVERVSERKQIVKEIDTQSLTAAAIAAKLMGTI
jgi:hypothetical protein